MIKSKFPIHIRRSRIDHKCCKCYKLIKKDTFYNYQKFVVYGRFGINKWHIDCSKFGQFIIAFKEWFKDKLNSNPITEGIKRIKSCR